MELFFLCTALSLHVLDHCMKLYWKRKTQRTAGPTDQPPGDSYIPPQTSFRGYKNVHEGHWNFTNDILHNLRNAEIISFSMVNFLTRLNVISLNISGLFLTELSNDIMLHPAWPFAKQKSIWISGAIMVSKRLTTLNSAPLMLNLNALGCIVFERRVGQ